jgi:hypothetical protein
MRLGLIQRANALLEGQQALVDLSTVDLGLLVLVDSISAAFAAGQVDEADLAGQPLPVAQLDLKNGV